MQSGENRALAPLLDGVKNVHWFFYIGNLYIDYLLLSHLYLKNITCKSLTIYMYIVKGVSIVIASWCLDTLRASISEDKKVNFTFSLLGRRNRCP